MNLALLTKRALESALTVTHAQAKRRMARWSP
jgi:hypothetical protein